MPRDAQYVAVYDVSADRERDRVAKVLEGFGMRVQKSAFELRLTPATRQTLLRRVEALQLQSGFLYLYRRAGGHDRTAAGTVPEDPLAEDRHAFVLGEAPPPAPSRPPQEPVTRPSQPRRTKRPCRGAPAETAFNPALPANLPGFAGWEAEAGGTSAANSATAP